MKFILWGQRPSALSQDDFEASFTSYLRSWDRKNNLNLMKVLMHSRCHDVIFWNPMIKSFHPLSKFLRLVTLKGSRRSRISTAIPDYDIGSAKNIPHWVLQKVWPQKYLSHIFLLLKLPLLWTLTAVAIRIWFSSLSRVEVAVSQSVWRHKKTSLYWTPCISGGDKGTQPHNASTPTSPRRSDSMSTA